MAMKTRAIFFAVCIAMIVIVGFNILRLTLTPFQTSQSEQVVRNSIRELFFDTLNHSTNHLKGQTSQLRKSWNDDRLRHSKDHSSSSAVSPASPMRGTRCPDILAGMSKGRWLTRPLTAFEQMSMDIYLQTERSAFRIPPTFQRRDGKCGNDLTYEETPQYNHMWFKSICNPKGSTPCCKDDRCVDLPVEECRCPNCFDERQAIYPEFSKWQPDDERCTPATFTKEEACRLLKGATIHVAGDSFVREVYIALAILLTGDNVSGALRKDLHENQWKQCLGLYQVTGAQCRYSIFEHGKLCGDTVKIQYTELWNAKDVDKLKKIMKELHETPRSFLVLGQGIHDNFKIDYVEAALLRPLAQAHRNLGLSEDQNVPVNSKLVLDANKQNAVNLVKFTEKLKGLKSKFFGNYSSTFKGRRPLSNEELPGVGEAKNNKNKKDLHINDLQSSKMNNEKRNTRHVYQNSAQSSISEFSDNVAQNQSANITKSKQDNKFSYQNRVQNQNNVTNNHISNKTKNSKTAHQLSAKRQGTDINHQLDVQSQNTDTNKEILNIKPTQDNGAQITDKNKEKNQLSGQNQGIDIKQQPGAQSQNIDSNKEIQDTKPAQDNGAQNTDKNKEKNHLSGQNQRTGIKQQPGAQSQNIDSNKEIQDTKPAQDNGAQSPDTSEDQHDTEETSNYEYDSDIDSSNNTEKKSISMSTLPHLFWMGIHAPGLLKSPHFEEQSADGVRRFNKAIGKILDEEGIPHLETFDFTNGVLSFDGTHYGFAINMLKANMMLTYIRDTYTQDGEWR